MPATLRYGIIGAGMMGREHIRNLALVPGARVTVIAEPDGTQQALSAREVEQHMGHRPAVVADARALLERSDIDALLIASPNDTHADLLTTAIAARPELAILCEKPVCTREADLERLALAAESHRAPLWVAMEYRYMPPVQALLRALAAGEAGRLRMLALREHRFPFLEKVGDWNRFNRRTGGTLVEKCCHFFDLMRLIVGSEPLRLYASGAADVNHRDERYGGETPDILDNAYVVVDFAGGVRALLDLCMFAEGSYWQEIITATGDAGRIEAFIPGPARFWPGGAERLAEIEISPRHPKGPRRATVPVEEPVLKAGDHHGSTYYQHRNFFRAVTEGAPVEVTLADGLAAVRMGLAAERSAREGQAVAL